jgi:peptide/nickel transport system permease protein
MTKYIIRRLLFAVPVVLGVATMVFIMLHLIPGDPITYFFSQDSMTEDQIQTIRERLGLNDPIHVQYIKYMAKTIQGDLGRSLRGGRAVSELISEQFKYTAELAFWGMLLAAVLGFSAGILAGINHNSWLDNTVMALSVAGVSIPAFWIGLMMIFTFSVRLHLLPSSGVGSWKHLVMPVIAVGIAQMAVIARMTRSNLVEVMQQDYVRTARAKGLRDRSVILRHAMKNALIPTITILGVQLGRLLAGAVVIETVFARPGIGRLVVFSILNKDFPAAQGVILVTAIIYVLTNIVVDVSYAFADPRIKVEE